jgi:hypothetical protein
MRRRSQRRATRWPLEDRIGWSVLGAGGAAAWTAIALLGGWVAVMSVVGIGAWIALVAIGVLTRGGR